MKLLSLKGICDRTSGLVADGCAHEDILGLLHLQAYTLLVLDIEVTKPSISHGSQLSAVQAKGRLCQPA